MNLLGKETLGKAAKAHNQSFMIETVATQSSPLVRSTRVLIPREPLVFLLCPAPTFFNIFYTPRLH